MSVLDFLGDPFAPEGDPNAPSPEVAPPSPKLAERVPAHLEGVDRRLWIIRAEIEAARDDVAKARGEGQLSRVSAMRRELRSLLEDEAALQPPRKRTADEEAAEFEAEARAVVAKIEAAVVRAEERLKL